MSEDCNHGHNSQSEESYFYKETQRLVDDLRRILALAKAGEEARREEPVKLGGKLAA